MSSGVASSISSIMLSAVSFSLKIRELAAYEVFLVTPHGSSLIDGKVVTPKTVLANYRVSSESTTSSKYFESYASFPYKVSNAGCGFSLLSTT